MNKKEEEGEFKDFTNKTKEEIEEKQYKNKVVFLHKSKAGNHLYAFDNNGAFADAKEGSIIINISDIEALLSNDFQSIKVSIMPKDSRKENE